MRHPQIEDEDIIERYVRNQLEPAEREAFEEHFFTCDDCFAKLEDAERFIAGIRHAARRGMLTGAVPQSAAGWNASSWLAPAFAASAIVAALLAVAAGWLDFVRLPAARRQLDRSAAELRAANQARTGLEARLRQGTKPEPNVPLVILQAARGAEAPEAEAVVPLGAPRLVLWIDAVPARYASYRLEIYGAADKPLATLDRLTRNSYGALAASFPAEQLPPGEFRIKLLGEEPHALSLLAEYKLKIRRP